MTPTTEQIQSAIEHFQNQIAVDLKELDGDTESDYAKFILQGHKHIRTALIYLKNEKDFRLFREKEKADLCRERDDLRAQLERDKGCESCENGRRQLISLMCTGGGKPKYYCPALHPRFCPMCGRPLPSPPGRA